MIVHKAIEDLIRDFREYTPFGQFIEADFGVVKYRNDGTLVWDRKYTNTAGSDDILTDMAIDSIGSVYLTGWETANFSTNYNFMTISYDSSGVFRYELIWSEPAGVGPDYGKKIGMDAQGNIYIAGDATDNCDGNTFVNGFRWDLQVNKYGPNSSVGINEPHQSSYRDWETDRKSTRLNSSHRL